LASLRAVIKKLSPSVKESTEVDFEDITFLDEKLLAITDACEAYHMQTAKKMLTD